MLFQIGTPKLQLELSRSLPAIPPPPWTFPGPSFGIQASQQSRHPQHKHFDNTTQPGRQTRPAGFLASQLVAIHGSRSYTESASRYCGYDRILVVPHSPGYPYPSTSSSHSKAAYRPRNVSRIPFPFPQAFPITQEDVSPLLTFPWVTDHNVTCDLTRLSAPVTFNTTSSLRPPLESPLNNTCLSFQSVCTRRVCLGNLAFGTLERSLISLVCGAIGR